MIQMSHGLALRTASTPTHTFRRNSGRLPHSIELRRGGEEFPHQLVQPALGTEADCMSCLSFSHLTFPNFYLCIRFHLFPCVTNNEAKLVPIWEMFSYLKTYTPPLRAIQDQVSSFDWFCTLLEFLPSAEEKLAVTSAHVTDPAL